MASHNIQLLAQAASDAIHAAAPRKKRKATTDLSSTYAAFDEEKKTSKKARFVPFSDDELRSCVDPDGTYVVTPETLKNKASSLRRFVETVRRDPTGVGASYLQSGNSISMRLPHGHKESVRVFSKAIPKKNVSDDVLDDEIVKLVTFMKKAGFNAAYPSFVQSFGFSKHARRSHALTVLASIQAASVDIPVNDLVEQTGDDMVQ
jgi:hypothetical protein